jgi:hypothetical protein
VPACLQGSAVLLDQGCDLREYPHRPYYIVPGQALAVTGHGSSLSPHRGVRSGTCGVSHRGDIGRFSDPHGQYSVIPKIEGQ